MLQTIAVIVTGKVQGVYYRQSTREKAIGLAISGNVRNLPDGTVQVLATGTKEQLGKLQEWCRQGPPRASVTEITVKELELQLFQGFLVVK